MKGIVNYAIKELKYLGMYVCLCVCVYVCVGLCICMCVCLCVHACMHMCVSVCEYGNAYVPSHIHTCIQVFNLYYTWLHFHAD